MAYEALACDTAACSAAAATAAPASAAYLEHGVIGRNLKPDAFEAACGLVQLREAGKSEAVLGKKIIELIADATDSSCLFIKRTSSVSDAPDILCLTPSIAENRQTVANVVRSAVV